jgi:hypothetical protein
MNNISGLVSKNSKNNIDFGENKGRFFFRRLDKRYFGYFWIRSYK